MQLFSPAKDTLNGFVIFRTGLLNPRARIKGVRIDCNSAYHTTASGLKYHVLRSGGKDTAQSGMLATIHEVTTLLNGTVVFDSYKDNTPITFQLGANQVITGVDEGVTGMRVGEKRRLLVPPSLSVRASYPANTPKDSTLRIDIELLDVQRR